MAWFVRSKKNIEKSQHRDMPDGLWTKCPSCNEIIYKAELEENYFTCKKCDYHFRIGSNDYINILLDEDSFEETNTDIRSADPLKFVDTKAYSDRLKVSNGKSKLNDALTTGTGRIDKREIVLACMNFSFIGGSMGSVVGEKFLRAGLQALEKRVPYISIAASGGARMQEAALSLMQMAKTGAVLAELAEAKVPYISILTDPTTGGVSASFAMLGDLNIAEPGALIGFAGPRVIEETIKKKLPAGFQRAEFLLEKGFLDMIVKRREMRKTLIEVLNWLE